MKNKKTTIGIIGLGKFGALVASILSASAEISVYNRTVNDEIRKTAKKLGVKLESLETVAKSDIVILAVSISATEKVVKQIASLVKPGALILDTCSVKILPVKWLKKYLPQSVEIMGTHPMFGPVSTNFKLEKRHYELKGKQIVLCPIRISKARLNKIKKFLRSLDLEVIETTPEDHDQQNAKTLSFVHFLGRSLTRADIGKQKIYTPGYADILKIIPHTNDDKWQLFCDMHAYNPYSSQVRQKFFQAADSLEEDLTKSIIEDLFQFNREMIDIIDTRIISLLKRRMECSRRIGKIKKQKGLSITDKKREAEIIEDRLRKSELSEQFIRNLYKLIFKESKKRQK